MQENQGFGVSGKAKNVRSYAQFTPNYRKVIRTDMSKFENRLIDSPMRGCIGRFFAVKTQRFYICHEEKYNVNFIGNLQLVFSFLYLLNKKRWWYYSYRQCEKLL